MRTQTAFPVRVRMRWIDFSPALQFYARRRFELALRRFASRIRGVRVEIADGNWPRGGDDTVCDVEILLHPSGSLLASASAPDAYQSVARAVRRARAVVRGHISRDLERDVRLPVKQIAWAMSTTVVINRPKTEREPSISPVAELAASDASLQPTGAGREQRLAGRVITVSGAEPFESGVLAHLRSLGGAGIVAAGFALAILIAGSAVALSLRLSVEAMIWIASLFRWFDHAPFSLTHARRPHPLGLTRPES